MTQKDYEKLAQVFRAVRLSGKPYEACADAMMLMLKADNPNFSFNKFITAVRK